MADLQTILVRVSGPDHAGITAGLMGLLEDSGARIQDVEQVVVRRRLALALAIEVPEGRDLLKELLLFGWEQEVDIDFEVVEPTPTTHAPGLVVNVMAAEVTAGDLGAVARTIAEGGGNIDRIVRLARYPVVSYELLVSGGDREAMRPALLALAQDRPFDLAVHDDGLGRRAKRLVVLDVDSTLVAGEMIELLAEEIGCAGEVKALTDEAMAGQLDFETALRQRVALFAGAPVSVLDKALARLELTPGARTFVRTLRRLGYKVAVVSGGFRAFVDPLVEELGLDHGFANELEIVDGRLTGRLLGAVVDRRRKADLLREIAAAEGIPLAQTIAVGDGANDIEMLDIAGLGVAFNARPVVEAAADTAVSVPYLDAILFLLGVRREEIEAADRADGIGVETGD